MKIVFDKISTKGDRRITNVQFFLLAIMSSALILEVLVQRNPRIVLPNFNYNINSSALNAIISGRRCKVSIGSWLYQSF